MAFRVIALSSSTEDPPSAFGTRGCKGSVLVCGSVVAFHEQAPISIARRSSSERSGVKIRSPCSHNDILIFHAFMVKTHQSPSDATPGPSLSKRKREQDEDTDSAKKTRSRVRYDRYGSRMGRVALNFQFSASRVENATVESKR